MAEEAAAEGRSLAECRWNKTHFYEFLYFFLRSHSASFNYRTRVFGRDDGERERKRGGEREIGRERRRNNYC